MKPLDSGGVSGDTPPPSPNLAVKVATALNIAPTGRLDLNAGKGLAVGTTVTNFFGVGNQSAAWAASAPQVMSTGMPGARFAAVYDSGTSRTVWSLASLGSGTVVLIR